MTDNAKEVAKLDMEYGKGLKIVDIDQAYRMAKYVAASGMVPYNLNTPEKVLVAAQTGMEAGLTFMAAVKSVYVIQGAPAWYSKAAKGLVLSKGICSNWQEFVTGEGDDRKAVVNSVRKGLEGSKQTEFSIKDAKRMQLLRVKDGVLEGKGKGGAWKSNATWVKSTDEMLLNRAIGRHCSTWYPDVLMGISIVEEIEDENWQNYSSDEPVPTEPDPLLAQLDETKPETSEQDKPAEPSDDKEPKVDKPEDIEDAEFEKVDPDLKAARDSLDIRDTRTPSDLEKRVRVDFIKLQEKQGTTDDMFAFDAFIKEHKGDEGLTENDWADLGVIVEQKLAEFEE
jgi:hypothetical protein